MEWLNQPAGLTNGEFILAITILTILACFKMVLIAKYFSRRRTIENGKSTKNIPDSNTNDKQPEK